MESAINETEARLEPVEIRVPTPHGRGSDYDAHTQWTMRKARAVYAASRGRRQGFRTWWRAFYNGSLNMNSPKLRKITDAMLNPPARKRAS